MIPRALLREFLVLYRKIYGVTNRESSERKYKYISIRTFEWYKKQDKLKKFRVSPYLHNQKNVLPTLSELTYIGMKNVS